MKAEAFAWWQPRYAKHGIATFPLKPAQKTPAIRGYQKVGIRGSAALAQKMPHADTFGFCLGQRSNITVLDVDTPDERVLADELDRYGPTPFIVQSGSGNWQAWYRHNGERRQIRPDPKRPVDILGDGFVVAPQSRGAKGYYRIIEGRLDDLDRLPVMRAANDAAPLSRLPALREGDGRNNALFNRARHLALQAQSEEELMTMVSQANCQFDESLPLNEVQSVSRSAWNYKQQGRLMVSGCEPTAVVFQSDLQVLWRSPDAVMLLIRLRHTHAWRNGEPFPLASAMAESMGWDIRRFRRARAILAELQFIEIVHPGGNGPKDPPLVRLL
jgi:hypothetical protein